jgi:hypothetical protein
MTMDLDPTNPEATEDFDWEAQLTQLQERLAPQASARASWGAPSSEVSGETDPASDPGSETEGADESGRGLPDPSALPAEETDEGDDPSTKTTDPATPTEPTPPTTFDLGGVTIPAPEAARLVDIYKSFQVDPAFAAHVTKSIDEYRNPAPPPFTPEAPPEGLDTEDPVAVKVWQELQSVKQQLHERQHETSQALQQVSAQKAQADITLAVQQFKIDNPDLQDSDIQSLRLRVHNMGILPSLMNTMPTDPVGAVRRSLDLALWDDPNYRQRRIQAPAAEEKKQANTKRQQKLSGLSGTSGSAPRRERPARVPVNDKEMKELILQDPLIQNLINQ